MQSGEEQSGPQEEVAKATVNSLGRDWLRNRMPPERMGLWARRYEIKERLFGSWAGAQALSGSLWLSLALSGSLFLSLPRGCLDDRAAAACISQRTVFWMGRNSRLRLGSSWPGRGWQGYSLGVLEGTGFEAETCHFSKIV